MKNNRSQSVDVKLYFRENRLETGLIVGTWLTYLGAMIFGILSFSLVKLKQNMEYVALTAILTFGSISYYIYVRAVSYNRLFEYYEVEFKTRLFTVTARSDTYPIIPAIIFVISILSWIFSIWYAWKSTETSVEESNPKVDIQDPSKQELNIQIIPSHCEAYNSVPGPCLKTVMKNLKSPNPSNPKSPKSPNPLSLKTELKNLKSPNPQSPNPQSPNRKSPNPLSLKTEFKNLKSPNPQSPNPQSPNPLSPIPKTPNSMAHLDTSVSNPSLSSIASSDESLGRDSFYDSKSDEPLGRDSFYDDI